MMLKWLAVAIAVASPSSPGPTRFDLACSITAQQVNESVATDEKPPFARMVLVFDLKARRYCARFPSQLGIAGEPCRGTRAIRRISPYSLELERGDYDGKITIDRETGAYLSDHTLTNRWGSVRFRSYAKCVPAPFSGLPSAMF